MQEAESGWQFDSLVEDLLALPIFVEPSLDWGERERDREREERESQRGEEREKERETESEKEGEREE